MASEMYWEYGDVPEQVMPVMDEGKCEVRIVCANDGAWIGLNSEGEFRAFAALSLPGEDKPVLACEDCDGWLRDVYATTEGS